MSKAQINTLIILSTIAVCVICSFFIALLVIINRNVETEKVTIINPTDNQIDTSNQVSTPTSVPPTIILPEAPEPTATNTPVVAVTPYDGPTDAYQPIATNSTVNPTSIPDALPQLTEASPWGDGGYGIFYDVPPTISRRTLLAFGYEVAREAMYGDDPPSYVTIHLQFEGHFSCNMGLGIGKSSLAKYLPATRPADLESWFAQLVQSHYYGDEPGQSIHLIAYGNDAANKPLCDLSHLKY